MPKSNIKQRDANVSSGTQRGFTTPPFSRGDLPDFDTKTFTSPSISFMEFRGRYKELSPVLRGISEDDLHWSTEFQRNQDPQGFQAFIDTQPEIFFEIGVAFKHGHAMVIVNTVEDDPPEAFVRCYGFERKYDVQGDNLRILHIRSDESGTGIEFALEGRSGIVSLERYYPQFRVLLTENKFKYIALQSFPTRAYQVLVNDCATFAHNFFTNLLGDLYQNGRLSGYNYERCKRDLVRDIRTQEGPKGETEFVSRQNQQLGASGSLILHASEES
ncbi:hypothetical protein F4679DRAFT_339274 [Xylaria curta]|nr:hypothetical protein F4679DRAFT_339274 [Xylaria curta]